MGKSEPGAVEFLPTVEQWAQAKKRIETLERELKYVAKFHHDLSHGQYSFEGCTRISCEGAKRVLDDASGK